MKINIMIFTYFDPMIKMSTIISLWFCTRTSPLTPVFYIQFFGENVSSVFSIKFWGVVCKKIETPLKESK